MLIISFPEELPSIVNPNTLDWLLLFQNEIPASQSSRAHKNVKWIIHISIHHYVTRDEYMTTTLSEIIV